MNLAPSWLTVLNHFIDNGQIIFTSPHAEEAIRELCKKSDELNSQTQTQTQKELEHEKV